MTGPPKPPDLAALSPNELYPLVYEELKRIAHHQLQARDTSATLSTTELVHEAFFKLAAPSSAQWEGRAHFFGAAARAMRQVLVEFARRRGAAKRGGAQTPVSLSDAHGAFQVELDQILSLNSALERLSAADERLARIVELRFFAGLPESQVAEILGVTTRTVERNWLKARLFLLRELDPDSPGRLPK